MSVLSPRTARRRKVASADDGMHLADLRPGETSRIVGIDERMAPATARRLHDLGFAPGGEVTVLRRAPLGDPVIVQLAELEVALRTAQCVGIRVQRTS